MLLSDEQIIQVTKQMYVYLIRQGVRAEVAKDLAQDAIIKAWRYEKEIPLEKQKAFIFKIVTNEFYKYPNTILQTSTEISDNNRKVEISEVNFKLLKDRFIPFTTATMSLDSDGIGSGYPTIEINLEEKEKDGEKYKVGINDLTTGNRLADYYHPLKKYSSMKQDLKKLSEFPKNTYLEMAISFDKAYSSLEVEKCYPII